jgi:hypothetical protein
MATKGRKPIPKTQKEISNSLIDPYDASRGNPNTTEELNRGKKTSFRDDTTKPLTVSIKDVDESIMYYFNEVIKPYVIQNGQRINVPIIYGNPERWKSVQKGGFYRDKNGKIMAPILMFKRDSISRVKLTNKLDANHPLNYYYFQSKYTTRNAYDKFNLLNNRIPEKQLYGITVPDYVNITYSCVIYTYYVEQMNKIVEAINYAADSYWGNPERFKFKAGIDSFTTAVELSEGSERVVKSSFDINMYGYIVPDVPQRDISSQQKMSTTSQVVFGIETVANINQIGTQGQIDVNNPNNTDVNS